MKKVLYTLPFALLFACGSNPETEVKKESDSEAIESTVENCTYNFNPEKTTVLWEAYKFTDRAAVGGKMDSVAVENLQNGGEALAVLANASFTIYTQSVNSNNPDRDKKIYEHFFGALAVPTEITGKMKSWTGQNFGKAVVELNFNGLTKDVEMDYSLNSEGRMKLEGTLNAEVFEAQKAVDALNSVCEELHTGTDGVSKLWPDFKITVISDFDKTCE